MKVAITGGNGHIGNTVILELLSRGFQINALVHINSKFLSSQPITLIHGSLNQKESLEKLMDGCDYLIHCAAVISINGDKDGRLYNTNVKALDNVFSVAMEKKLKRVIHVSSIHAYNHFPCNEELNETREFVSDNAYMYDKSKRDGQRVASEYIKKGLPIIIVNPTAVFGAPNYVNCKQNSAFISMSKRKLPFVFKGGYNWVDVKDVANSICNALSQGTVGSSYILGGSYFSLKELSKAVSTVIKKNIFCFELPIWLVKLFLPFITLYYKITGKDPSVTKESIEILQFGNKYISSLKANAELGHTARSIETTISELLQWQSTNK